MLFVNFDLMWNCIISIGSFYIAISFPNFFNDFALPSLIHFVNFAVFQIRFLFLVWRFQNIEIDFERESDISLRRKMMKFYLMLCKIINLFRSMSILQSSFNIFYFNIQNYSLFYPYYYIPSSNYL